MALRSPAIMDKIQAAIATVPPFERDKTARADLA